MAFVGFAEHGGVTFVVPISTVNTTFVPTAASAMPTYRVYTNNLVSPIENGSCVTANVTATGLYLIPLQVTNPNYAAGQRYNIRVDYIINSNNRSDDYSFNVV